MNLTNGIVVIASLMLASQPDPPAPPPLRPVQVYDLRDGLTAIVFSRGDGSPAITLVSKMTPQEASVEFGGIPVIGYDEAPPWQCGLLAGDANRDGVVDFADTTAVLANWGARCSVESWGARP